MVRTLGSVRFMGSQGSVRASALGEQGFGDAVNDQIGITPDRRGEVGVAGSGEGKMALVLLAVTRLLERAQHEVRENALFGLAGDLGGEALIHLRRDWNLLRD